MASTLVIAPLGEGWQGTPQDLLDWIQEQSAIVAPGGNAFTGQIGGARPTNNVGLYVYLAEGDANASARSAQRIEYWDGSQYLPFPTVPIGTIIDWASVAPLPDNYIEADGAVYNKTDYPELYAVFKGLYLRSTDLGETVFRVPDARGRYTAGTGQGVYNPQAVTSGWLGTSTNMLPLKIAGSSSGTPESSGPYLGWEWPTPKIPITSQTMPPHPTLMTLATTSGTVGKEYPFTKSTTYYHGIRPPTLVTRKIIFAGKRRV